MIKLAEFIVENYESLSDDERFVLSVGIKALEIESAEVLMEMKVGLKINYDEELSKRVATYNSAISFGAAVMSRKGRSCREKDCGDMLTLLWKYKLPHLELTGREVVLPSGKRADMLAINKETGKDVVIELKCADASSERKAVLQVNNYRKELELLHGRPFDALVISDSIIADDDDGFITWGDLGVNCNYSTVPDDFDLGDLNEITNCHNSMPIKGSLGLMYRYDVLKDYMENEIMAA